MSRNDQGPVHDFYPAGGVNGSDCNHTATLTGLDPNKTRGSLFKTTQDSSNYVTLTMAGTGNLVKTDEWAKGVLHPVDQFTAVTVTGTVTFQIGGGA